VASLLPGRDLICGGGLLPTEALDGAVKIIQGLLRLPSAPTLILQLDAMSAATPNGTPLAHVLERHVDRSAALGAFDVEVHDDASQWPALNESCRPDIGDHIPCV